MAATTKSPRARRTKFGVHATDLRGRPARTRREADEREKEKAEEAAFAALVATPLGSLVMRTRRWAPSRGGCGDVAGSISANSV